MLFGHGKLCKLYEMNAVLDYLLTWGLPGCQSTHEIYSGYLSVEYYSV